MKQQSCVYKSIIQFKSTNYGRYKIRIVKFSRRKLRHYHFHPPDGNLQG